MEVIEVSGYVAEEKLAIAKVMNLYCLLLLINIYIFYLELFNTISNKTNSCTRK